jgi:hypothetical protein
VSEPEDKDTHRTNTAVQQLILGLISVKIRCNDLIELEKFFYPRCAQAL